MAMITTGTAAKRLGVTCQTVRRLISAGKLPAILLGGEKRPQARIDERDLDAFVDTHKLGGEPYVDPDILGERTVHLDSAP